MAGKLRKGFPEADGPIRANDIFPDLDEDIDRRIAYSEQRIKSWVLAGIAINLLLAISAAIPTIFYMGQISSNINQSLQTQRDQQIELAARAKWINDRMIWEAKMEAWMNQRDGRPNALESPRQ